MKGHTDRATINARRPMSAAMVAFLKTAAAAPDGVFVESGEQIAKNRASALMDRGFVTPETVPYGKRWKITPAGQAEVDRLAGDAR